MAEESKAAVSGRAAGAGAGSGAGAGAQGATGESVGLFKRVKGDDIPQWTDSQFKKAKNLVIKAWVKATGDEFSSPSVADWRKWDKKGVPTTVIAIINETLEALVAPVGQGGAGAGGAVAAPLASVPEDAPLLQRVVDMLTTKLKSELDSIKAEVVSSIKASLGGGSSEGGSHVSRSSDTQARFRSDLEDIYRDECGHVMGAFSGSKPYEAMHIIPLTRFKRKFAQDPFWERGAMLYQSFSGADKKKGRVFVLGQLVGDTTPAESDLFKPFNGILGGRAHHLAFDGLRLSIDGDQRMVVWDTMGKLPTSLTEEDMESWSGQRIKLAEVLAPSSKVDATVAKTRALLRFHHGCCAARYCDRWQAKFNRRDRDTLPEFVHYNWVGHDVKPTNPLRFTDDYKAAAAEAYSLLKLMRETKFPSPKSSPRAPGDASAAGAGAGAGAGPAGDESKE